MKRTELRELLKEWKEVIEKEKRKKLVRVSKEAILIAMKQTILEIWKKAGEPFYARFVIGPQKKMITGLVIEWTINGEEMKVKLIQERLENAKIVPKEEKIKTKIEEVEDVVLFRTKKGKIL